MVGLTQVLGTNTPGKQSNKGRDSGRSSNRPFLITKTHDCNNVTKERSMFSFGPFCFYQQGINRDGYLVSMTCIVNRQAHVQPTGSLVNCLHSNLSDATYLRTA